MYILAPLAIIREVLLPGMDLDWNGMYFPYDIAIHYCATLVTVHV